MFNYLNNMSGIPYNNANPNQNFLDFFSNKETFQGNNQANSHFVVTDKNNHFEVAYSNGTINKLDKTCPHNGCPVNYVDGDKQFVCPCHRSKFNINGNCLEGPACPNNLKKLDN